MVPGGRSENGKTVDIRRVRGIKRDPDEFSVLRSRLLAVACGLPSSLCRGLLHRLHSGETLSCVGLSNRRELALSFVAAHFIRAEVPSM